MKSICELKSSQSRHFGGTPTRGKARKMGVRVECSPVTPARQNGELADSASSTGTWMRMPLATWIARSAPSTPTWTWRPNSSSCRATKRSALIRSR